MRRAGFTLVELMVVVVIGGLLTVVAVPAFFKYARRSRSVEATLNIRKLYDSSIAYYQAVHADHDGEPTAAQFPPSAVRTPAARCCTQPGGKCAPTPATFTDAAGAWASLHFWIEEPFAFQYQYYSAGSEATSKFEAYAYGDLDCDGTLSTYMRSGSVLSDGSVTGERGLFVKYDNE